MPYTPNNPYIPGDPYSYDLKWLVSQVKANRAILETLDERIRKIVTAELDQHDPVYYQTAQNLIDSAQKAPSIAYIEGYHSAGDGGANLYYITDDYNDVLAADFYITLSGANRWAIPVILTPYVTPEMFGAYADGVTDDTSAFDTALKYKNVYLGSKSYAVYDSGITLTNGSCLIGHRSWILLHSTETNSHVIRNSGKSSITITGISFDGANASGSQYASAIQLLHSSDVTIRDCDFYNFTNNAVQFSYCSNCILENAEIDSTGLTVAYDSDHITFRDLKVTNCVFPYHLQLKSSQHSIISHCYVQMNNVSEFAIMVSYGNAETDPEANAFNTVEDCTVVYTGSDVSVAAYRTNGPSSNITYRNCIADGASFYISDATDVKIDGCTSQSSSTHGIIVNNLDNSIITGCLIKDAEFSGITVSNQVAPVLIANNILLDNNQAANTNYRQIAVASGCSHVDIISNMISMDSAATTYLIGLSGTPEYIRVISNSCIGGGAIINGSPDISSSVIRENGFGTYRGFNGFTSLNCELTVNEGQTIIGKYFTAAPGTGTFAAGDIALIKTPTAAIPLGWSYDGAAWNVI